MQVLKQILEEIESLGREHPYKILGIPDTYSHYNEAWQDCVDRVEGIIQRRMIETEPNTVVEWCPHCEKEIEICWDVEKDGYQIFCPNCGKAIMLCSMCDGGICDWTEKGCKHKRYATTNDTGWIPVEERLPENAKHKGALCPKYYVMTKYGETVGWYNPDYESWFVLLWFVTERFDEIDIDLERGSIPKVARDPYKSGFVKAWKNTTLEVQKGENI